MSDSISIPAPQGSTEPAAPQVTTPIAEQTSPQAETPVGLPQAEEPAGTSDEQKAASDQTQEDQSQEDPTKTWKEKRQERNRARWQEYKEAKTVLPQRLSYLEQEVARLRGQSPPDFNQITDPTEGLAKRSAWEYRQTQADDAEARLKQEREHGQHEIDTRLQNAWQEHVEDARKRIPDFDQVVTPQTPIHARMAPMLVDSENGADIAYWLGLPANRDSAQALYQKFETAPAQALFELGQIAAKITAAPPKNVSTAPKPAPILAGGVSPLNFDASKASVEDMQANLRKAGILRH